MQGDDPRYYLAIATPKHFAVHSGPEPTRHFADVDVSRHDQVDTYEPAFRAAIVEGKAGSIMCAYNAVKGQPACANQTMLESDLRGAWGFRGYVVSDCGAVRDIFSGHRYRPTQAQASAISLTRGMDNECIDFLDVARDDSDYRPYIEAVQQGYLSEAAVDTALVRLFTARMRLGMFDPPAMVPYQHIDPRELDSAEHRALALKLANESIVLLKNDGTLPLRPEIRRIAVVGPLAEQTRVLLGNYNGTPTHSTSVLDALKTEFPHATITYVPGTQFLRNVGTPVPSQLLTTVDGKPGLTAAYSERPLEDDSTTGAKDLLRHTEPNIAITAASLPSQAAGKHPLRVVWTGILTPVETGEYLLGVRANGSMRLRVDGRLAALQYGSQGAEAQMAHVHLTKGVGMPIEVTYAATETAPEAELIWAPVNNAPDPEAAAAARQADLTIAVVGITSQLEGEDMPVDQPGFLGGDRTSIDLPEPEEALVEEVAATGKPLVVVLMNGSALAVNWINKHANAVLESWYSGEEGGNAVAETLSGKNNPAGRLPVTFYADTSQLPNFEDYSMQHRTYRYFDGKPLYPFGYGLSYTTFSYSDLQLSTPSLTAGEPLEAQVQVTNTGKRAGDEVVQLYLKFPDIPGAPHLALRAFKRIHLEAGASQTVHLTLHDRDLSMVTEDGYPMVAAGDYTITVGGGQPGTGAVVQSVKLHIKGDFRLPQ
jgi:beta-glucosidase